MGYLLGAGLALAGRSRCLDGRSAGEPAAGRHHSGGYACMSQSVLITERLRLRPRTLADLDACVALDLDPEVHRFIFGDRPPDPGEHRARLRARIASGWPAKGGVWVVEWRHAPGFLGWCGLFPLEDAGPIEIGYRYVRGAWGRGIATEAGRAVLDHGFRALASIRSSG